MFVAPGSGHGEDELLFDELLEVIEKPVRTSIAAGDPHVNLVTYGVNVSRSAEDRALAGGPEPIGAR